MAVTSIVTLADVLPHLNMGVTEPAAVLAELQGFIDATAPIIEDMVGHVIPAAFDEFYSGGNASIWLRELPVLSVASVSEVIGMTRYTLTSQPVGASVDAYGYTFENAEYGILTRRGAGGMVYPFFANTDNIEVVYTAGRATVPANIRIGTLELIRHWWQIGQQAAGQVSSFAPGSQASDDTGMVSTPSGYLVPPRVYEALKPSLRPLVIA